MTIKTRLRMRPVRGSITIVAGVLTLAMAACKGDSLGDMKLPSPDALDLYWKLDLNYRALNLALTPGSDTVRLTPIPRNPAGTVLTATPDATTYTVLNPNAVQVSADGLVTAKGLTDDAAIIVRSTLGSVTHEDTAHVRIVATPPASPLQDFSIQPLPGDSARWSITLFPKPIFPVATAQDGSPLFNLMVAFTSSDNSIAIYDALQGGLVANLRGSVKIFASTYAFGVAARDSVTFTITYPTVQLIQIAQKPAAEGQPATIIIGPDTTVLLVGGVIVVGNLGDANSRAVGLVFDDSTAVDAPPAWFLFPLPDMGAGNIPPIPPLSLFGAGRSFNHPGKYLYHDDLGQATAVIDVRTKDQ